MSIETRLALAWAGVLVLGMTSARCGGSASPADPPGGSRHAGTPAVPVTTARAITKAVPQIVETVGSAEAYSTVEVRAQVSGILTTVSFAEGEDVTAGQTLFTLDARPFQVALQQAQATLAKDSAQYTNADTIRSRDLDLLKRGILAHADYDTAASQAASLLGAVAADQAQVDAAKLQLEYTTITAPVAGRTGAILVHVGNLVRTTDTSSLVVINQITPIRVALAVPGLYLSQVRSGQARAALATDARAAGSTDAWSHGAISFIDNTVDPATGTIKVKGTFPNTDRRLWPGELVEVSLTLSVDAHAVVVPAEAVQNGQQGQYVYVVQTDKTVALRPVAIARTNGDDAIVTSGVTAGEEVVTDGQLALTAGAHIAIKPSAGVKGTRP